MAQGHRAVSGPVRGRTPRGAPDGRGWRDAKRAPTPAAPRELSGNFRVLNYLIFKANKAYPDRSSWIRWNKCLTFRIP
jgi:hypothetical protein